MTWNGSLTLGKQGVRSHTRQMSTPYRRLKVTPGITLTATPVLDTYWAFAAMRQDVFYRRVRNEPPPWTSDQVLAAHRFTNAFRASDRVSQYLIRHVLYSGDQSAPEVFFRAMVFKIFNRVDTWTALTATLGEVSWSEFSLSRYSEVLDKLQRQRAVYSAAYIMPSPPYGERRKHRNHLRLLVEMMRDGMPQRIQDAASLKQVYELFRRYPSLGPFLAFQFTIDMNYSTICNFSEMDFVVAGPGAKNGIAKCFVDRRGLSDEDLVRVITENAENEFTRLGLRFEGLFGRSLQLIDCQNLFCEVDKYARVVHPEFSARSNRKRIKQRFTSCARPIPQWYPPKWGLVVPGSSSPSSPLERAAERLAQPAL